METKDMVILGVVALAAWLLLRDKGPGSEPLVQQTKPSIRLLDPNEVFSEREADELVAQFQPYRIGGV